jgi:hypothetical protein
MVFCQDERINHFMNLTPQPLSSEEPEQQPALDSSEETPIEPAPASDSLAEEPERSASEDIPTQLAASSEEDIPTQPAASSEPPAEETEQQAAASSESNGAEASTLDEDETSAADEDEAFTADEDETSALDEDEAFESELVISSLSQPARSGVFIRKGLLIGAAIAVVVVAVLVALLLFVNRPKDPPTDWIASYTPPAGTSNTGKVLYYLHWTNQNGELKGQLQLAAKTNGTLQSLTAPATGLYNRDNHIIYVVIVINGQADTLTGKINDNDDTLTLNLAGATSQSNQFVFHIGSADDYKQATKNLGSATK